MAKADGGGGKTVLPFTRQHLGFGSGSHSEPPGGDPLEARVAKLESHVEHIRSDISDLKSDARAIASDMVALKLASASVESKLRDIDRHMVTKGQLAIWAMLMVIAGAGGAFAGGWWIIQQYLAPILKAIPK